VLWSLFKQLVSGNPNLFPNDEKSVVYDCGNMIVSKAKLPIADLTTVTHELNAVSSAIYL
jgi:hypothetical protein